MQDFPFFRMEIILALACGFSAPVSNKSRETKISILDNGQNREQMRVFVPTRS